MSKKFKVAPKIKKKVAYYLDNAIKALNLQEWSIDTLYHKDEKPSERRDESGKPINIAGEMTVDPRYLLATLKLYPTGYNLDDDMLRDVIFHETSHVWTEHIKELAYSVFKDEGETKDAWESLTSRIAGLAIAYDNRKKKSKKS